MSESPASAPVSKPQAATLEVPTAATVDYRRRKHIKESIRRDYQKRTLEQQLGTVDPSIFKSPKVIGGILAIMILLGVLLTNKSDTSKRFDNRFAKAIREVEVMAIASGLYYYHTGQWPERPMDLARRPISTVHTWDGPYINWVFKDGWKNEYIFRVDPAQLKNKAIVPDIRSAGPDGLPDTADDIVAPASAFIPDPELLRPEAKPRPAFRIVK